MNAKRKKYREHFKKNVLKLRFMFNKTVYNSAMEAHTHEAHHETSIGRHIAIVLS